MEISKENQKMYSLRMGGHGGPDHHFSKPKFKQGDVVRIIEEDSGRDELVNTLAVITDISSAQGLHNYSIVSLQGHGEQAWFDETSLQLALAVEDLIKVANSNMV